MMFRCIFWGLKKKLGKQRKVIKYLHCIVYKCIIWNIWCIIYLVAWGICINNYVSPTLINPLGSLKNFWARLWRILWCVRRKNKSENEKRYTYISVNFDFHRIFQRKMEPHFSLYIFSPIFFTQKSPSIQHEKNTNIATIFQTRPRELKVS